MTVAGGNCGDDELLAAVDEIATALAELRARRNGTGLTECGVDKLFAHVDRQIEERQGPVCL